MQAGKTIGFVLAAALLAAGCAEESSSADDAGARDDAGETPGDDGGVDVDEDGEAGDVPVDGGAELSVIVTTSAWPDRTETPAVGATIALEQGGAVLDERVADAEGRATFAGIDWSAGPVALTAHLDGFAVVSRTGIVEADGEVEIGLFTSDAPADYVELSGTATGLLDAANDVVVSATVGHLSSDEVTAPDWSITVPAGEAMTLVGLEVGTTETLPSGRGFDRSVMRWTTAAQPALTGPATADIDFSAAVTPTTVTGSFDIPARTDSPYRTSGYGFVVVSSLTSRQALLAGQCSRSDLRADWSGFEYELQYLELAEVADPVTLFVATHGSIERSITVVEGWPTGGDHDPGFLDPPAMVAPATPSTRHPLHDPVVWSSPHAGLDAYLAIFGDEATLWRVDAAAGATEIVVPQLPSSIDEATLLGPLVEGRITLLQRHPSGEYSERFSLSGNFILDP